jgi:hypothetical protein
LIEFVQTSSITEGPDGLLINLGALALDLKTSVLDRELISNYPTDLIPTILETEQESLVLLGFYNIERRDLYRNLRLISGVGRETALLALSLGESGDILRAAVSEDTSFFLQVPGIGLSRAKSIINSIKKRYKGSLPKPTSIPVQLWVDVRQEVAEYDRSVEDKIDAFLIDSDLNSKITHSQLLELCKERINKQPA